MSHLSKKEINEYNEKGYFAPIDALTKDETDEVREEMISVVKSDFHSFSIPLTVDINFGENWGILH